MHRSFRFAPLALLVLAAPTTAQCPEWASGFHIATNGPVSSTWVEGARLIVGGDFSAAGSVSARNIAAWDGTAWSPLAGGRTYTVLAVCEFDAGSGPLVWAGGNGRLSFFDGASWADVEVTGTVNELEVYDDGSGPALFAAGSMTELAGLPVSGIARLSAAGVWSNPGDLDFTAQGGVGLVRDLEVFDDGVTTRLAVSGRFEVAGGVGAMGVALYDGTTYAALGDGTISGGAASVQALATYDDGMGQGPQLYVGGEFDAIGGVVADGWARFDGAGFSALPAGLDRPRDFVVFDAPGGSVLFAQGRVASNGGTEFLTWDGAAVTILSTNPHALPLALDVYGSPQRVIVGLNFSPLTQGSQGPGYLAVWDGTALSAFEPGLGVGDSFEDSVQDTVLYDFGAGPELVAVGRFVTAGGTAASFVARFDGSRWADVGSNLAADSFQDEGVNSIVVHDEGFGPQLYVTGAGLTVDGLGTPAARFDGTAWVGLGSGTIGDKPVVASFDEGQGPRLFLGGGFISVDGTNNLRKVARWDGSSWSALGVGLGGNEVTEMVVWDDGTGEALYVAGGISGAGQVDLSGIGRWDGSEWSDLDGGFFLTSLELALTPWESPDGDVLVVTGLINHAGGDPVDNLAAWDGSSWSEIGGGVSGGGRALAAFDPDGQGERLFVGGTLASFDGMTGRLGAWDGTSWEVVAGSYATEGGTASIESLIEFSDDDTRQLFVAGRFSSMAGVVSHNVARYSDPCGEDLGTPVCTSNENSTGERALLRADGSASLAAQDVTVTTRCMPPGNFLLRYFGPTPIDVPFGEGRRCVGGVTQRIYPVVSSDGSGTHSSALDFSAPYAGALSAGSTLFFQGWYRDAMGGPAGFNTTDALRITFRP